MSMWTAEGTYGAVPAIQPTGGAGPQPNPSASTPISTQPAPGAGGLISEPSFWLVALLAVAIGLIHVSICLS